MASGRILRGDGKKAIALLSDIVQDFEHSSIGPPTPQVSRLALADAAPFDARTNTRFTQFLTSSTQPRLYILLSLGVLSTSRTFMGVFEHERDGLWKALLTELETYMGFVTFYARSRQLPWREALINYFDKIGDTGPDSAPFRSGVWPSDVPVHPLGLDDDILQGENPHTFYCRLDGGADRNLVSSGSRKNLPIVNIDQSICDRRTWPKATPPTWPANRKYPDHPQNVRNATVGIPASQADDFLRCGICNQTFVDIASDNIGCTCVSWHVDYPCVLVREYFPYPSAPTLVNKGVMAMQIFTSNEIIGEYVGMLLPPGRTDPNIKNNVFADDVYTMDLNAAVIARVKGQTTSMPGGKIADVSAVWKGNWTRFINTSPLKADWNIELEQRLVADRIRIPVRTIRPILFGEELIASYGTDYMKSLFGDSWAP
ncbi:hypothetical protein V493_08421 [Pseudogymnoascus sp. VKM F-4281 (FW-2241)]|nr:hypothetical protein V493_08421 [Pseudogymnoascus sp. VKM F-4281 (FW-2241)]